jgi:hypothetical protein
LNHQSKKDNTFRVSQNSREDSGAKSNFWSFQMINSKSWKKMYCSLWIDHLKRSKIWLCRILVSIYRIL